MYYSPPIVVDLSPPVMPLTSDAEWGAMYYWTSPNDVHFAWNTTSHPAWARQASTAALIDCPCHVFGCCIQIQVPDNIPDPEASPVYSECVAPPTRLFAEIICIS